ncbi:MAG: hypothetical protein K8U57_21105 [Planctomycetes bacterium]|nr:hypothetical protein [Planctomycetota bacterium]
MAFDAPMDVNTTPLVTISVPSVRIASAGWSGDGALYTVRINCEEGGKVEGVVYTLQVSRAKDLRGNTMAPLNVPVVMVRD